MILVYILKYLHNFIKYRIFFTFYSNKFTRIYLVFIKKIIYIAFDLNTYIFRYTILKTLFLSIYSGRPPLPLPYPLLPLHPSI